MTDKYSVAKFEHYGRRLAARLCDQHFAASEAAPLDGPAILGFTPIRQINLLVVRQLLFAWQAETSRLRSPYFDFEAPTVQAALVEFQNTLSRYIKLSRDVFEPLLARAVAQTIQLVTEPATALPQLLVAGQRHITLTDFQQGLRYIVLNKELFERFIATLPQQDTLIPDVVWPQLQAYQQTHYRVQQPLAQLVASLSILLPLTEADLRADGPLSFLASSTPAGGAVPLVPEVSSPTIAATQPEKLTEQVESGAGTEVRPEAGNKSLNYDQLAAVPPPLHEKLKAAQPAAVPLATTLRASQFQPAVLGEREAVKIGTLREAISINQRFSFINELFNGENMEYHAAIHHLDTLNSLELAREYITLNLAQRYDWSRKEEHVAKLFKLVERKLAPN